MSVFSKSSGILAYIVSFGATIFSAQGAALNIDMVTTDGTVPGTSVTYTISNTGGTARNYFASALSDDGIWSWQGGYPEFVSLGIQTLSVTFSDPVELSRLVFAVNSLSTTVASVSVTGGTGSTADFDLTDGISNVLSVGRLDFNPSTGIFSNTHADYGLMVGSTSSNTITGLTLTGNGGGDGYTFAVGFLEPSATPEPATALLFGSVFAVAGVWKKRRMVS